jgi:hypothetical protein
MYGNYSGVKVKHRGYDLLYLFETILFDLIDDEENQHGEGKDKIAP